MSEKIKTSDTDLSAHSPDELRHDVLLTKETIKNRKDSLIKKRKDALSDRDITKKRKGSTLLVKETKSMERKRRLREQDGERRLARVNAREHPDEETQNSPEQAAENGILQHPNLDNQRFDGIDPNLNPEPPLNTDARREYDNEKREQEMEKQLRLGNMPKFSSAPTPRGPQ